jgi:hypothetical protein
LKISNDKIISKQTFITLLAWALAVVLIMGPPGQANANTTTPPDGTFALYSESSGGWYFGAPILDRSIESLPLIQTRLNPIVIGLCNAGVSGLIVATMDSTADGIVNLKCGTSTEGYVHIRAKHQFGWENQKGSGGLWDDYMVWATTNTLGAPSIVVNKLGQKRCYSTPILVFKYVNGTPQYVKTFHPTVIVSTNNKVVVTSIPTTTSTC